MTNSRFTKCCALNQRKRWLIMACSPLLLQFTSFL